MLGGELAVLQAPMFDGLSFDPFALFYDGLGSPEVGVGRRHIVQALVIPLVVVMLDERLDLDFQIAAAQVISLILGLEILWLASPELFGFIGQWDQRIEKILG